LEPTVLNTTRPARLGYRAGLYLGQQGLGAAGGLLEGAGEDGGKGGSVSGGAGAVVRQKAGG
jgi:hypothetical protein